MVGDGAIVDRVEAMDMARYLVVHEGHTYAQAAEASGLPHSTIQKRGAAEGWQAMRKTALSYEATVRRLKTELLDAAVEAAAKGEANAAAQATHAWRQAEQAWPEHRYGKDGKDPQVYLSVALELLELLVEWLAERSPAALRLLQPLIPDFAQTLEARYAA